MSYVAKFPHGGFEYTVFTKDDILETIDKNITDPDVLNDIITHLEDNILRYVESGRWVGYPYLGSFKPRDYGKEAEKVKLKEQLKDAKMALNDTAYLAFKTDLTKNIKKKVAFNNTYTTIVNMSCKRNVEYYNKIKRHLRKSNVHKRLIMFFLYNINLVTQYNPDGYYEIQ